MFFLVLDNLIKLDVLFGIIMIIMRNTCYNIKSSKLVKTDLSNKVKRENLAIKQDLGVCPFEWSET